MYWLIGHPTRFVTITTTYQINPTTKCSWKLQIKENTGNLRFNLQYIQPETHTGSKITLYTEDDLFRPDTMLRFLKQLQKLQDITYVKFLVKTSNDYTNLNNSPASDTVWIDLFPNLIGIQDMATGIPLEVLFKSLLIPSISTKTIALSEQGVRKNAEFGLQTKMLPTTPRDEFVILFLSSFSLTCGIRVSYLQLCSTRRR